MKCPRVLKIVAGGRCILRAAVFWSICLAGVFVCGMYVFLRGAPIGTPYTTILVVSQPLAIVAGGDGRPHRPLAAVIAGELCIFPI